jgi:hypothetical protein
VDAHSRAVTNGYTNHKGVRRQFNCYQPTNVNFFLPLPT